MTLETANPKDLRIDTQNERRTLDVLDSFSEFFDEQLEDLDDVDWDAVQAIPDHKLDDLGDFGQLMKSVAEIGIVQPPLVRNTPDTSGHTVVVGQRRTLAARSAGLTEMPIIVMDWSDEEALKASITENIDLFAKRVPMQDRAQALQRMWEMMGGSGMPVQSHLASELGVPRETVRTWLEPLHDGWKDTSIDPTTVNEDPDDDTTPVGEDLGERSLAEIRRMTGGGEEGEQCVRFAEGNAMTQPEIQDARTLVDEEGLDPLDALKQIAFEDENDETVARISAEVEFDSTSSQAIKSYADREGKPPATVIVEAVKWFLKSEGELDD